MVVKYTSREKLFLGLNYIFLGLLACISLFPIVNILATSFSSKDAAMSGQVLIWPVEFSTKAYEFVIRNPVFWSTFRVSILRILIGLPINMIVIVPAAYALSVTNPRFRGRSMFTWFFMGSILFSGGLIPLLMTINNLKINNTIWSLVLPTAAPVFYIIILMNFFKGIPSELSEAAELDGASHTHIMMKIFVPLSKASISTVLLLCFVLHWNSWFDGLLYMNRVEDYPLQSYLQTIVTRNIDPTLIAKNPEQWAIINQISERTMKCAQIFIATIPIMIVYPYLQKNFTKGMIVGAVKG